MEYIISGICILICVVVIIFGLRVLKEFRKMNPKKPKDYEEEEEMRRLRP